MTREKLWRAYAARNPSFAGDTFKKIFGMT
jgi:hypothetical protein